MKRILISLMTIAIVAVVGFAVTRAYFSDTETSTGNRITAGILNLEFDTPAVMPFTISDLKPSYHKESPVIGLKFENNPGRLYKMVTDFDCTQGTQTEPEIAEEATLGETGCANVGEPFGKCDLFNYTWFDLKINGTQVIPDEQVLLGPGPDYTGFDTMAMSKWIYLGTYNPGSDGWAYVNLQQSFHMKSDVTNWAQGDTCEMKEQFLVTQDNTPFEEQGCASVPTPTPGTICNLLP